MRPLLFIGITVFSIVFVQCKKDSALTVDCEINNSPTPATLEMPIHFQNYVSPVEGDNNPLTVEGIALGKKLFYEKALSVDGTFSCGSCHEAAFGFTDANLALSPGVNGTLGTKNAMPIMNLAWNDKLFWDGRSESLEEQAFLPVIDDLEMHNTWPNASSTLQNMPIYPPMFDAAFGTDLIDSTLIVKAIAQFERTLISGNSKWDKVYRRIFLFEPNTTFLTPLEEEGRTVYSSEDKGDCTHCHGDLSIDILITKNTFHNNGLDFSPDSGLAKVTKNPDDLGKFKAPSLRNLLFTAPYMHDGRFETLEEVIDHYSDHVKRNSPNFTLDANLGKNFSPGQLEGGVELTPQDKIALIAFLKTLTDSTFINNPKFQE